MNRELFVSLSQTFIISLMNVFAYIPQIVSYLSLLINILTLILCVIKVIKEIKK